MEIKFNYHESLLALTSVVAKADGELEKSEIDARVHMILTEKIESSVIDSFKTKYEVLSKDIEKTFNTAMSCLKDLSQEQKAKAVAWMYLVANTTSSSDDEEIDLSNLEEVESWSNNDNYVDLSELHYINTAKKTLKLKLAEIKEAFAAIPTPKRI